MAMHVNQNSANQRKERKELTDRLSDMENDVEQLEEWSLNEDCVLDSPITYESGWCNMEGKV